jgi:hypothetical protein
MRTLAHALIQKRFVEKGDTTRLIVLPVPESGLPDTLVEAGQPVTLDLLSGRPVNLTLGEKGLEADLCFAGPPVHCTFPWEAVLATQDTSGTLVQTMVVTIATVMEDSSLQATEPMAEETASMVSNPSTTPPKMALIKNGDSEEATQEQEQERKRPSLRVVPSPDSPDETST